MIERRPRAPALRVKAFLEIAPRASSEPQVDVLHLEQALVLLHQSVLGFDENALERRLAEVIEHRYHR
jgi:hypothetical protein